MMLLLICYLYFFKRIELNNNILILEEKLKNEQYNLEVQKQNNKALILNNEKLILENVKYKTQNGLLEKTNKDLTDFTENISLKTKAHFFEMGKSLTSQLIELQKKESSTQREESESMINKSIKHIMDKFNSVNQHVGSLKEQLEVSQNSFNRITDNILNPVKIQNLTEITLENILHASGIRKDIDFFIQPSFFTNNSILRPDAIVKLPDGKLLLIDAKSTAATTEDLVRSMNTHVKQLSGKDYINSALKAYNLQETEGHFTAMFVSSESILDKVLKEDKNFLTNAWNKNIFPVGPTGLINLLVMSKYSITNYERDKNHKLILQEITKLLNSIYTMFEYTKKTSKSLSAFNNNFNKIITCMNSSVFRSVDKIQDLGLKHNKGLNNLDKIPIDSLNGREID